MVNHDADRRIRGGCPAGAVFQGQCDEAPLVRWADEDFGLYMLEERTGCLLFWSGNGDTRDGCTTRCITLTTIFILPAAAEWAGYSPTRSCNR